MLFSNDFHLQQQNSFEAAFSGGFHSQQQGNKKKICIEKTNGKLLYRKFCITDCYEELMLSQLTFEKHYKLLTL